MRCGSRSFGPGGEGRKPGDQQEDAPCGHHRQDIGNLAQRTEVQQYELQGRSQQQHGADRPEHAGSPAGRKPGKQAANDRPQQRHTGGPYHPVQRQDGERAGRTDHPQQHCSGDRCHRRGRRVAEARGVPVAVDPQVPCGLHQIDQGNQFERHRPGLALDVEQRLIEQCGAKEHETHGRQPVRPELICANQPLRLQGCRQRAADRECQKHLADWCGPLLRQGKHPGQQQHGQRAARHGACCFIARIGSVTGEHQQREQDLAGEHQRQRVLHREPGRTGDSQDQQDQAGAGHDQTAGGTAAQPRNDEAHADRNQRAEVEQFGNMPVLQPHQFTRHGDTEPGGGVDAEYRPHGLLPPVQ